MFTDPNAVHQIRLDRSGEWTAVRCRCKQAALALISPKDSPWPQYNRAENHDNSKEQFVPRAVPPGQQVFDVQ